MTNANGEGLAWKSCQLYPQNISVDQLHQLTIALKNFKDTL